MDRMTFDELTEQRGTLRYLRDGVYTLEDAPLWYHTQGLQQTASGYGRKLTSRRTVRLKDGRVRRMYVTQYSNAGTCWINLDGHTFVVVPY